MKPAQLIRQEHDMLKKALDLLLHTFDLDDQSNYTHKQRTALETARLALKIASEP